jgi:hypothetical protein
MTFREMLRQTWAYEKRRHAALLPDYIVALTMLVVAYAWSSCG